ncbi:MAG TPA: poly-gamma-glutamate system protein [Myxococcota bacterium]|nr:poly-gamma-glutamate system protein [Myxococcota bacterium]
MKLYWRPGKISNASLTALAILAVLAIIIVEKNKVVIKQPYYDAKVRAANLQMRGMEVIKAEVLSKRKKIDKFADPAESGMIGTSLSPITSVVGYLDAKQTSINPNFAAVVIDMLGKVGVSEGDYVAIGGSGSFPSLNLAAFVACKVMKLNCVPIMSVSASMYGANDPRLTWLDMEWLLYNAGIIDHRSIATSIGGKDDNAEQLPEAGVELAIAAATRNKVPLIRTGSLIGNIDERMRLFEAAAGDKSYKVYINIGGGEASGGSHLTRSLFRPGVNKRLPRKASDEEGAMLRMMRDFGTPAIHLSGVTKIAERYGLEVAPKKMPVPGEGQLFYNLQYNLVLVAILLAVLILATVLVIQFDIGRYIGRIQQK